MRTDILIRNTLLRMPTTVHIFMYYMAMLICYVCVQLYTYITCGQFSVKRSYDMNEPYSYVTHFHYKK